MADNKEIDQAFNAAKTIEALEKEAQLRFGSRVQVRFDPEFPITRINAPDSSNYRFSEGMTVAGVTLQSDLRNIAGMAEEIRAIRGVTNPLVVSERADGTAWLKQGFRRYNGVLLIQKQEPNSPLANKLSNLPCLIYTGLSAEQEKLLVNDQTSKRFSKAEVFTIFCQEIDGGFNWVNVCERNYRQIAEVTGGHEAVRKIDNISDPENRLTEIKEYFNTFVYQGWYSGIKSGPLLRDMWMQTYLWQDGFKGARRPRVIMDSMRQRALWSEILKDQTHGEWKAAEGTGPRMEKKLQEFQDQDDKRYDADGNKIPVKKDPDAVKLKSLKDVQDLIVTEEGKNAGKPTLLSRVYRIVLKNGGDPEATQLVRNFERCRESFNNHRNYLKPVMRELCRLIFDGNEGSHDNFDSILTDNYDVVAPEPVIEVTPEPVAPEPVVEEKDVMPAVEIHRVPEAGDEPEPEPEPEPEGEVFSLTQGATNLPDGGEHPPRRKKSGKKAHTS